MIYLKWLDDTKKIRELSLAASNLTKKELISLYEEIVENYIQLDRKYHFSEEINIEYIFRQVSDLHDRKNLSLYPIPFGIKDIFNTKILKTAMGSEIWKGFDAGNNARIVDGILENGGVIFSKTTTAEFAVHYLPHLKTLNPRSIKHITGTSSSGSAVAIACGALPICLGSQSGASTTRPASFCGVYGFKPSFGAFDRTGVLKTADTLDTIGLLSNDLQGMSQAFDSLRMKGDNYPLSKNYSSNYEKYKSKQIIRVATLAHDFRGFSNYADDVVKDFNEFIRCISELDFIKIVQIKKDISFINKIHALHDLIYTKSLAYYFQKEFSETEKTSDIMISMISRGKEINTRDYVLALEKQIELTREMNTVFEECDLILTPSTATTAPLIGEAEKDDTGLIWTFFGYPCISLPLFKSDAIGLPFGLLVVAKKYDDFALLDFASRIQNSLQQNIR